MFQEAKAKELLKEYAPSESSYEKVLKHSEAVKEVAISITEDIRKIKVNKDLVRIGSLLHDIGRFVNPPGEEGYKHAYKGGKILEKEGIDHRIIFIVKRHIGSGLTKEEIREKDMDLPEKDFIPETVEEKIVCYADNLVFEDRKGDFNKAVKKFRNEISSYKALKRLRKLHNELEELRNRNNKIPVKM